MLRSTGENPAGGAGSRKRNTWVPRGLPSLDASAEEEEATVSTDRVATRPAPLPSLRAAGEPAPEFTPTLDDDPLFSETFKVFRERWIARGEREYIRRLLHSCDHNVGEVSRRAGIDRTYVYRLMRKYRL
jgi:transcriptional regulator of acetoin/glycerol metabolism